MVQQIKKRVGLVPNWKKSWKWASVQISTLGVVLLGILELISNSIIKLPAHILKDIPHGTTIALVLFSLSIVGRLIRWSSTDEDEVDNGSK